MAAQEAQRARSSVDGLASDLSSARLLRPAKRPPQSGWRRVLYLLSGRLINLGESPADLRRRLLTARVNQPLHGCYKIAMLSLKGGVGKTTVTATLGATFSSLRGDRVVAVDANPDRGTLSQKIPLETSATVRHLLRDAGRLRRYTDVRAYTSQGPSRLEVLASEQDPAVSEAFSEDDYRRTVNLLEHFYNIVLTDCGTGLMHSAMYGVLGVADQLIIVSSGFDRRRPQRVGDDGLAGRARARRPGPELGRGDQLRAPRRPAGWTWTGWRRTSRRAAGRWCRSRSTPTWRRGRRWSWTGWSRRPGWPCWSWRPRWPTPSTAPARLTAGADGRLTTERRLVAAADLLVELPQELRVVVRAADRWAAPAGPAGAAAGAAASALDAVFIAFHSTRAMTAAPMNAMRNNTVNHLRLRG